MPTPSPSAAASAPPPQTVTEVVTRPDGLRRGTWEARPVFFYVALGVTAVAAIAIVATRLRRLRFKRTNTRT